MDRDYLSALQRQVPVSVLGVLLIAGVASANSNNVTFNHDVAPILYEKCVRCHREGEIAPMPLLTYNETRPWARALNTENFRTTAN